MQQPPGGWQQQSPGGWQQQPPPGYGQPAGAPPPGYRQQPVHGQHPQYRHGPPLPPPGPPPPKKRRRAPWVVLGVVFGVLLLLAGYLFLTYSRSVGAPASAEPVPPQCAASAGLLAQIGAPSWQSGPIHSSGKLQGVSCRWVAADDENVAQRNLSVNVDDHGSVKAAAKQVSTRSKGFGTGTRELDGVGDQAFVWSSDGIVSLVARRGQVTFDLELTGSDKSFFSGILGDSVETEVPAAQLEDAAIAVVKELAAKAK